MGRKGKKDPNYLKRQISGVVTLAVAVFCLASFYVESQAGAAHALGPAGHLLSLVFSTLVGDGKFLLGALGIFWGIRLIRCKTVPFINTRNGGSIVLFLVVISFWHIKYTAALGYWEAIVSGSKGLGGGTIGSLLSVALYAVFGPMGIYIVLGALGIIGVLMMVDDSPRSILKSFWTKVINIYIYFRNKLVDFLFTTVEGDDESQVKAKGKAKKKREDLIIIDHGEAKQNQEKGGVNELAVLVTAEDVSGDKGPEQILAEIPVPSQEKSMPPEAGFTLPPLTLLKPSLKLRNPRINKDITDNVKTLEETLESFGVKGKVTQVSCGPTITRYELQPAPGIKVSKIVNLADDIALSLAAPQVRIEAPIPGKAAVGIEVPNKEIAIVHFREVLETEEFLQSKSILTVAFGKDIAGKPVVADLAKMPHLLIAGATGSGKSVCMNALICSLLFKARPDQLKILMIDPKMVELNNYNGIPHLVAPVVTDPKKAAGALRWAVSEMEKRYELFATAGVRDITRYNELRESSPEGGEPPLPFIVVLVDELADLMMVAPADVEDAICRLAQMARAAGIHLVVATQRPSVDVITGLIKANIPSRVAFAVSSQIDSRTILDMGGAEKLLGRGDMLLYPVGYSKPIRVQGVFVADKEVEAIVSYLKKQAEPQYREEVVNLPEDGGAEIEIDDDLLPDAARIVIESGQASISMLQRRLRVGYNRAARLMDLLEAKGVVGGFEGSKPRAVLIGWDEYNRLFGS
ncbi:MAG: DNA translocase FtsK [Clostridia bacterium]|nr:DNA translocase FtsK [Clostridia bacterium]